MIVPSGTIKGLRNPLTITEFSYIIHIHVFLFYTENSISVVFFFCTLTHLPPPWHSQTSRILYCPVRRVLRLFSHYSLGRLNRLWMVSVLCPIGCFCPLEPSYSVNQVRKHMLLPAPCVCRVYFAHDTGILREHYRKVGCVHNRVL